MMDHQSQLKLQAYLDDELPGREARRVDAWLAADAEARALLGELRNTRQALADNEMPIRLPETREFCWSKIEHEIKHQEMATSAPVASRVGVWWKRILVPAASVACLATILVVAIKQFDGRGGKTPGRHELVAALTDSGAITYRDDAAGVTLVWFSYPSQN